MPISHMGVLERIARILAGRRASANAAGSQASASEEVDQRWRDHLDDAAAILHTLREPDSDMAAAGDVLIWQRMVEAALKAAARE